MFGVGKKTLTNRQLMRPVFVVGDVGGANSGEIDFASSAGFEAGE